MPPRAPNVLADAIAAVAVHDLQVAPITMQQRAAYVSRITAIDGVAVTYFDGTSASASRAL
jgi:hypothetical protein